MRVSQPNWMESFLGDHRFRYFGYYVELTTYVSGLCRWIAKRKKEKKNTEFSSIFRNRMLQPLLSFVVWTSNVSFRSMTYYKLASNREIRTSSAIYCQHTISWHKITTKKPNTAHTASHTAQLTHNHAAACAASSTFSLAYMPSQQNSWLDSLFNVFRAHSSL